MASNIIILGIKISNLPKENVLNKIKQFLVDGKQHYLVTPNAEIVLNATEDDEELFYILNQADLAMADAISLKFAAWAMFKNLIRFTGADLVKDTLALAEQKNIKIAVMNWNQGLSKAEEIKETLRKKYPKLKFFVDEIDRQSSYNFNEINDFAPAILFVALGSPWQEKFIYHNLNKIPSVKIGLGIGGSFDYLTSKLPRAPGIMRQMGLEWLWRLFKQPKRWKRIYHAVIVFPIKFIKYNFFNKFFYRRNVVGLIFNADKEILLVNWHGQADYWGLPQGGVKRGETDEQAIIREIKEEINLTEFKILGKYRNLYRYKWPKSYTNNGYKGQKQTLFILKLNNGTKEDIKLNYWEHKAWKWVKVNELLHEADPIHREAYNLFLEKFNKVIK